MGWWSKYENTKWWVYYQKYAQSNKITVPIQSVLPKKWLTYQRVKQLTQPHWWHVISSICILPSKMSHPSEVSVTSWPLLDQSPSCCGYYPRKKNSTYLQHYIHPFQNQYRKMSMQKNKGWWIWCVINFNIPPISLCGNVEHIHEITVRYAFCINGEYKWYHRSIPPLLIYIRTQANGVSLRKNPPKCIAKKLTVLATISRLIFLGIAQNLHPWTAILWMK